MDLNLSTNKDLSFKNPRRQGYTVYMIRLRIKILYHNEKLLN